MSMIRKHTLYEVLLKRVESKEDKTIDVNQISTTLNSLANLDISYHIHYIQVCSLALHHDLITNDGVLLSNVPFGGSVLYGGAGIIYNFIRFPFLLQQIIAEYIEYYSV